MPACPRLFTAQQLSGFWLRGTTSSPLRSFASLLRLRQSAASPTPPNPISATAASRQAQIQTLLSQNFRPSRLGSELARIYHQDQANFFEDQHLRRTLRRVAHRLTHPSMRAFVMDHLFRAEPTAFEQYVEESGQLCDTAQAEWVVRSAMGHGDVLLAAILALRASSATTQALDVSPDTVGRIALMLLVPDSNQVHAYTVLRLAEAYTIQPQFLYKVIENLCERQPFWANVLFDKVSGRPDLDATQVYPTLIEKNAAQGNFLRAGKFWLAACKTDHTFAQKHLPLFVAMHQRILDGNLAAEVMRTLTLEDRASPSVRDYALWYLGRVGLSQEFDALTKMLEVPLDRLTLSVLLASFLAQKKDSAADRVLQSILRTTHKLHARDFEAITTALLAAGKLARVESMCRSTAFEVSHMGKFKLLESLKGPDERRRLMDGIVKDLDAALYNEDILERFTLVMFRILTGINCRSSRKLYNDLVHGDVGDFHFGSYGMPDMGRFLRITDKTKMECLEIIRGQAISDRDEVVVEWYAHELQRLGIPNVDIPGYVNRRPQSGP